jgi:cytochrome P450
LTFRYHLNRSTFGAREITPAEATESRRLVDQTLRNLIAQNHASPGDNLIAGLIATEIELEDGSRRKLTEEELFGYCKLTIFAGGGTTWRQLGITIIALLERYEFWEACRDNRSLLDQAIEESIRWRTTTAMMPRLCTQDTEVEGTMVPAGARVFLSIGSANHDPKVFDRPDEFDIFRKKQTHVGFGFGPHRCLGIDVARQELILAINGLMDRWPNMTIDASKPRPQFIGLDQRGMSSVKVRLT